MVVLALVHTLTLAHMDGKDNADVLSVRMPAPFFVAISRAGRRVHIWEGKVQNNLRVDFGKYERVAGVK